MTGVTVVCDALQLLGSWLLGSCFARVGVWRSITYLPAVRILYLHPHNAANTVIESTLNLSAPSGLRIQPWL